MTAGAGSTPPPEVPVGPVGAVDWADRVVVVLVQPLQSGNVGGAARALKNFGLRHLVLVDPPAFDPERARWMAPGCDDLLDRVRIVGTLDEALEGVHEVVGTTARHRRVGPEVIEPPALAGRLLAGPPDRRTAILFGREDFGLPNEAVARCRSLVRIATPEHASLNLAQAVLLVTYELFQEARRHGAAEASGRTLGGSRGARSTAEAARRGDPRDRLADVPLLEPAVEELVTVLDRVGYLAGTPAEKVRATARAALQTAGLSVRHVEALRGMIGRVRRALDRG